MKAIKSAINAVLHINAAHIGHAELVYCIAANRMAAKII